MSLDISNLATQDNADTGVWMPVVLYGKQCDFDLKILGDDSDTVIKHSRKAMRKYDGTMSDIGKGKVPDDKTLDEIKNDENEAVLIRIAGIRGWKDDGKGRKEEPVTLNGKELKNDADSYRLLLSKIPAIKEFVLKASRDRANFLSRPSGN